ncbi:MAG: NAD(P)H-dependent dehydrogenase/reductase [Desulfobacterales bacterium]|nr:NAD(P)H-dependent dehydrogenase/reductase [Desulfobacterales bacterium]
MFLKLLSSRRSIRQFKDKPVEKEKINRLVEAALRAPSSRSLNPWEFIVVTDANLLAGMAECKPHGATFLKGAPLGIVVLADPKRCDVWVEDSSIASIFIHLAAHSLQLGSCWIQVRQRMHDDSTSAGEYIADLLDIPGSFEVESIVAVGYPESPLPGHKLESLAYAKIHREKYGTAFS